MTEWEEGGGGLRRTFSIQNNKQWLRPRLWTFVEGLCWCISVRLVPVLSYLMSEIELLSFALLSLTLDDYHGQSRSNFINSSYMPSNGFSQSVHGFGFDL